jgi:hypothetical protein
MKNLQKFSVQEMGAQELQKVNGGGYWWVVSLVIAMVNDAQNNPDDYNSGFNATHNAGAGDDFY